MLKISAGQAAGEIFFRAWPTRIVVLVQIRYLNWLKLTLIVSVSGCLCCCKVGPNFHPPAAPDTDKYTALPLPHKTVQIPGAGKAGSAQLFMIGRDIPKKWWALFHSAPLNRLIEQGIKNSPNLAAAKATLVQARELLRAQIGESYLPAIDLALSAGRAQTSGLNFGFLGSNIFTVYSADLKASYLLDIFGGQRRLVETYRARVDYERYELLAAYLSLTSNIVTSYVDIASFQAQIKTTLKLIKDQTEILAIVKKQLRVGGASKKDVISQETLLAQTKATLPPLRKVLSSTQHALAVLVGKLPSDFMPMYYNLNNLKLPAKLPVSIPSVLVKQRPDIQASQALLHEASAEVGVATANLYPQIKITADFGWVSQTLSNFFGPNRNTWSYAAGLLQPIFRGFSLHAKKRAAVAAFQKFFAQYRQTVLEAFKEVSDVLRAIGFDAKEFLAQHQAETYAKRTLDITLKQFRVGGADYLNVLNAEQKYQQTKLNRIKAQTARYTDTVVLFQALGGGWQNHPINAESLHAAGIKNVKLPAPEISLPAPHAERAKAASGKGAKS